MAGSGLESFTVMHESLNGVGCLCSRKLLLLGLLSLDYGDCKEILEEISIDVEHLNRTLLSFLSGCMSSVAFLPKEFSGTKERSGFFFPSDNRAPLVINLGKISV